MPVVNKLIVLILSLIFINQNLLAVNTAQSESADNQYESMIHRSFRNLEKSHVQHKRVKREDDNAQVNYVLTGFLENGTIPVNFPKDICLFELKGVLYASALHFSNHPDNLVNQSILLTIFKSVENGGFAEIFTYKTESALDMDCMAMDDTGFVVISNNIEHDIENLDEGSPVFRITSDTVQIVQYFSKPFQNKIYLRRYGNSLFLMQLIVSQPKTLNVCPIFIWNSNHFDLIDELPCTNSMNMEQFDIDTDVYVALANYKDELGQTATFSYIYKYNMEHKKFVLHQQVRTNAAMDVTYFNINDEHFLVFANSYEMLDNGKKNFETQSVIYKHSDDYFTPFQTMLLYGVEQFVPVMGSEHEFTLLVSCKDQAPKSWQYNGWSFIESDVQFTGGALGQGVSNLRTYSFNGSIALVVANTLMAKEASNIFFPQFVPKEASHVVQQTIEKWCAANKLDATSIDDAKKLAIELQKFPMRSIPDVPNVNEINFLEEVTIDTITTKQFRVKDMVLDQQFADKINEMLDAIENLNKRLDDMEKSSTQRNTMADESKQESMFQYAQNTLHSDAQVVGKGNEIESEKESSVLDVEELTIGNMIIMDSINGHPFADMVLVHRDLNVSEIVVNELILTNPRNYMDIIGKGNQEVMVKSASESFATPTTGIVENMKVNSLLVDGLINRLDLALLNEYALKIRGDQVIDSEINFESLKATSLQAASTVSKRQIDEIVRTVEGPFIVDQAIQFIKPVFINELIVKQRINNINVLNGAFNILLKRSDHDQVIQALKIFDEVKLLNPIVLQGKITKSNLNKINPIVSIANDIVLEGDYEIRGNTTIIRVIRGENFYGNGGVYNANDLLLDGLRLDTPVIEQIFEFVQPIKVTNLLSKSVNNVDVTKLVRTGEEIQHVYGEKNFLGDLHVMNGFCEAFTINDINLSVLNDTVLKRTGAQTIDGKITFNSIRVQRASAQSVNLFGHKFSDFLTKTDQIIPGNVTIKGNLIVNNIQIENIRTNKRICNYDVGALIADTITTTTGASVQITGDKFFRDHLTLENVQIRGNVFQLGTMDSLLGHLNTLSEDVKLNGPITLTNNLRVGKLTFAQNINGMSSTDFGYQWLLSETNQDFTAPQTISVIRTDENVILNGTLNNVDVVNHFGLTQFKDELINFKNASFVRAVFQQPITLNGLVSGIKFPDDIVLRDSDVLQSISGAAVNDINVAGKITVEGRINDIDFNIACDLLSPNPSPYTLVLERDAIFAHAPQIEYLNELNVNQLYNEVWLSNRNAELTGIPRFSHVQFSRPIEIKGLLNGFDVGYIGSHYVSLTKPQEIVAEVEINGNVLFQGDIRSGSLHLNGVIKDFNSGTTIKIEEFDQNVLKKDIDQVITGEWYITELNVAGDFNSLVNGLNVVADVARFSNPINNVTSFKTFESVAVTNLNCLYGCTLMDVDVGDWLSKVVFATGNYTIQGTTVMDAPLFYNNLNVLGVVNNVTFTPDNILLKSTQQNINGNVYISNKSVNDNRILPLSFANVQLDSINGKSLKDLYLNVVYKDDPLSSINTRMEFNELVTVDYVQLYADLNGVSLNELIDKFQLYREVTNYGEHVQQLNIIGNGIVDELKAKRNYMATYRLQQVIFGNIKKILSVEVTTPTETFDVFVVLNVTDINGFLNFYIFDRETSVLALANSLFGFQPKDMHILDIFSIRVSDRDFLVVQTQNHFSGAFGHSFFTHFKGQFRNVYELHDNVSREIVGLNMVTDDCFVTYSRHATNVAIACAFFNQPGILGFQQVDELYSSSGVVQVRSITSSNRVEVIVLDLEGKISVWSLDQQHKFIRSQIIKALHTTTQISAIHHKGFHYIAACSETPTRSTHLGSIEIYTSPANAYANMQSIVIESPTRIELSVVASTGDLVLYALTDTIAKPLVVYRFTGINKFEEFTAGVTIPRAQRLNVLKARVLGKELISLISEGVGGMIIEAKVK